MQSLFILLAAIHRSAAHSAAALGMTRQAYQQARARCHLSESKAMIAAALLGITPAAALLINATGKHPPAPISHTAPDLPAQITDEKKPAKNRTRVTNNTNYATLRLQKKCSTNGAMQKTEAHFLPQSKDRQFKNDCVRWMLTVPRLSPDSPRFAYYFSRWVVPEKIAASKLRGDFDELTKNCPLYSPELINFIQAGIDAYKEFIKPIKRTRTYSSIAPAPVKALTAA